MSKSKAGRKTAKQRKRELLARKAKIQPLIAKDLVRFGNSLIRGQKW